MSFIASVTSNLGKGESIVLPISMFQPLERGERLASILCYLRDHHLEKNTTILIADYLNRHNNLSDEAALALGDEFLSEHESFFHGFNVVRWKDYMEQKKASFTKALTAIEEASQEGSLLHNKMRKTWEKCMSAVHNLESSIKYQQEEYALLLCKDEFKHLIYPKRITNAMAFIYKNFSEYNLPEYHHIKITEFDAQQPTEKKESRHLHVAFRGILEHVEFLLDSDQLSEKAKRKFVEELENTLALKGMYSIANSVSSMDDVIQESIN